MDQDVILWTINMVRKKLCSVIALPQAFLLDSLTLAQLQMLDPKLLELQSILDGSKMDPYVNPSAKLVLNEVKQFAYRMEDIVEEVEYEVLRSKSASIGRSSGEVAGSSPNQIELNKNELDPKQSGADRKRKFASGDYVQEIIGMVDGVVDRAKEVLLVDLYSGNKKLKREKVLHEGNISKTSGETSNQMHDLFLKQVSSLGSDPNVFPGVVTQKAEQLGNDLDSLIEDVRRFGLHDVSFDRIKSKKIIRIAPSSSLVDLNATFGRSKDVNHVLRMLLSENDGRRSGISVLAVTGMGGLGKTTLARLVYNHLKVREYFDRMVWVSVSEDFDVFRLTRNILESFAREPFRLSQLDSLQSELSQQVMGRRFLLVLDDVWNENRSLWEALMSPLRSARFAHVIVTTRNMGVARMVQTMSTYSLGSLSYKSSFSLFKSYAFHRGLHASDDLIKIAKRIVENCNGNPLMVKLIGSLLASKYDIVFWKEIMNKELWDYGYEYLPALKISYDQLPPKLKFFFTMFSLFPKGYVFSKNDVTKLWLALDFVEPKISQTPEVIANNYFEDFVQRSLIEQNRYNDARRKGFIMHDLLHAMAQNLAAEEFIRAEAGQQISLVNNPGAHSKYRRYVSIIVNDLPKVVNLRPWQEYHQLRLLQIINKANKWNNCIGIDMSDEQFQFLRHLRILDLRHTGIEALPSSVGNLKQLRYLNLTKTNIAKLPESITYLCYLQTLELRGCPLRELPQGITKLVNLRHLNFFDKNTCMPHGIGWLTKLQTLPVFNIKRGSWHCEISELNGLKNLQGELTITGLRNVSSAKGAEQANLQSKDMLNVLTLDWSTAAHTNCDHYKVSSFGATHSDLERYDDLELRNIETVFEYLKPNIGLKELNIIDYSGSRFPKWFGDVSFSRLTKISLNGCGENCKVLPTLGFLPSLKYLYVSWMYNIQFIGREFCSPNLETKGFQSLETLEFKYMPNWVQWYGVEDGEFCGLNALKIVCCNELQFLPQTLSSSFTKLLINNCKELSALPFLPSLTRITVSGQLSESLLHNLQLPSLQFLKIACTESITSLSLSEWKVPSLEVLVIKGCKYLQFIAGFSSIITLKRLEIVHCRSVQISSSEEIPQSLQHMTIVRCHWLEEWHHVITMKYRDQLNKCRAANNSWEALEGTRDEETEENDEALMSTNDFVLQERPRIMEEQLTAERRKGKSLESGESSYRN